MPHGHINMGGNIWKNIEIELLLDMKFETQSLLNGGFSTYERVLSYLDNC